MLLLIVENSGPGFRGGEKFVLAVRHYLCEALLLNSTSSNRAVMELSLKIFKPMCRDFKVMFGPVRRLTVGRGGYSKSVVKKAGECSL